MAEKEMDWAGAARPDATTSPIVEGEDGGIDVSALLRMLLRGKKTILSVTLGVFAIATAIAFLLPRRYTSTVSFIPPAVSGNNSMASVVAGQLSALGAGELLGSGKGPGDLYAGILRSRSIASELIKRFDLMGVYRVKKESEAEKILNSSTAVTVDIKSTIVTVEVIDRSPSRAHDLANAYMDALRETDGRLALNQASQRRLFFEQQL